MDLPRGVRAVRPLVAAPRPESISFVGAFRADDLEVDRRAGARLVEVFLAEAFLAEAFFAEAFFAEAFAEAFFGGLA